MRICMISDLHGNLPEIEPCDLLLIGGDISPVASHDLVFQRSWLESNFAAWCDSLDVENIVAIAGNHDFIFEEDKMYYKRLELVIPSLIYLEDSKYEIGELSIWGSPWSRQFGSWAFMTNELQLERIYNSIPEVDIILSHNPPYGCGDRVVSGEYVGSSDLRSKIKAIKPKLVVCGHIHEGFGHYKIGECLVKNASLMNEFYEFVNKPMYLEL
jgi:Icc-related predicted phosphoesterase